MALDTCYRYKCTIDNGFGINKADLLFCKNEHTGLITIIVQHYAIPPFFSRVILYGTIFLYRIRNPEMNVTGSIGIE
jgi:hypothetical protein